MKAKCRKRQPVELPRSQIIQIEEDYGITLSSPKHVMRSPNEQFGVYDEDGIHAGDVIAAKMFFDESELRAAILELVE